MNNNISTLIRLSILSLALLGVRAGAQITLSLEETVAIAGDSSLEAFRSKNMYLTGYRQYRTYKAGRLPGAFARHTISVPGRMPQANQSRIMNHKYM
jgi:hypothetical protein